MPPRFTKPLADRLNNLSPLTVKEAENGDILKPGVILIAPGGYHMEFSSQGDDAIVRLGLGPMNMLYRPSVDLMMLSAVESIEKPLLGVIMTGMGNDGLQ